MRVQVLVFCSKLINKNRRIFYYFVAFRRKRKTIKILLVIDRMRPTPSPSKPIFFATADPTHSLHSLATADATPSPRIGADCVSELNRYHSWQVYHPEEAQSS